MESFKRHTHTDGKSNGANQHGRGVVFLGLCPLVCQFKAPLLQSDTASLKVWLLVEDPAVVGAGGERDMAVSLEFGYSKI